MQPKEAYDLHWELLCETYNHPITLEAHDRLRKAARRVEEDQVLKVMHELHILQTIYENKGRYCRSMTEKDNVLSNLAPQVQRNEDQLGSLVSIIEDVTDKALNNSV
ncbi:hypothetical protein MA16_Dca026616 [Dendrobium catenatum]|uniref:Uncharacterized protein n=1 Tax=Dendrobium catenatum TaxID=906689 RepID=A0A2I0V812_9ASPA|nr:hypothetical protein MA16_Dca026616 [Dendrobium catenatum]